MMTPHAFRLQHWSLTFPLFKTHLQVVQEGTDTYFLETLTVEVINSRKESPPAPPPSVTVWIRFVFLSCRHLRTYISGSSAVTLWCWFPGSSDLPAGYVKCFHMKHVLWSQWNVQSGIQMKSCVRRELCTPAETLVLLLKSSTFAELCQLSKLKFPYENTTFFPLIHQAHHLRFKDSARSESAFYRPVIPSSREALQQEASPIRIGFPASVWVRTQPDHWVGVTSRSPAARSSGKKPTQARLSGVDLRSSVDTGTRWTGKEHI